MEVVWKECCRATRSYLGSTPLTLSRGAALRQVARLLTQVTYILTPVLIPRYPVDKADEVGDVGKGHQDSIRSDRSCRHLSQREPYSCAHHQLLTCPPRSDFVDRRFVGKGAWHRVGPVRMSGCQALPRSLTPRHRDLDAMRPRDGVGTPWQVVGTPAPPKLCLGLRQHLDWLDANPFPCLVPLKSTGNNNKDSSWYGPHA